MINRLGIETISAFGLPPVDYVNLAADLDCAHISLGLSHIDINPHGYAPTILGTVPHIAILVDEVTELSLAW